MFLGQVIKYDQNTRIFETHLGKRTLVMGQEPKIGDYLFMDENRKIFVGGNSDIMGDPEAKKRYQKFNDIDSDAVDEERKALMEEAESLGIKFQANIKTETLRKKIEEERVKLLQGVDNSHEEGGNV